MSLVIDGTFGSLLCVAVACLCVQTRHEGKTDHSNSPICAKDIAVIVGAICVMGMMIMCFFLCYYLVEKVKSAGSAINLKWTKFVSFMKRP